MSVQLDHYSLAKFEDAGAQWERLAANGDSPFLTAAWLASWWRAFASRDEELALALCADDGTMLAGGCFRGAGRSLNAAVNSHTNDWGIVARDDAARQRFWAEVAALPRRAFALKPLLDIDGEVSAPRDALREAGYRLVEEELNPNPWLELPDSLESLLADRSRNLRSQVGRRRRGLQREGELKLRVVPDGPSLEHDLDAFFALEAAGWKGRSGTAIEADPALVQLYREFADRASAGGWFRLYMLEVGGRLVAADYGCVFGGCGYLVKTAFDENLGRLAPGLVLRAEVLRASIEEGLARYDFLGDPDDYKMRWADRLRRRAALHAFRGSGAMPAYLWHRRLRPRVKSAHVWSREQRAAFRRARSRRRQARRAG